MTKMDPGYHQLKEWIKEDSTADQLAARVKCSVASIKVLCEALITYKAEVAACKAELTGSKGEVDNLVALLREAKEEKSKDDKKECATCSKDAAATKVTGAAKAASDIAGTVDAMVKQLTEARQDFRAVAKVSKKSAQLDRPKAAAVCPGISEHDMSLCPAHGDDSKTCILEHPPPCTNTGRDGCFPVRKLDCKAWHLQYPLSELKAKKDAERAAKNKEQKKRKAGNSSGSNKSHAPAQRRHQGRGPGEGKHRPARPWRNEMHQGNHHHQQQRQQPQRSRPQQQQKWQQQQFNVPPPGSKSYAEVAARPGLTDAQLANMAATAVVPNQVPQRTSLEMIVQQFARSLAQYL